MATKEPDSFNDEEQFKDALAQSKGWFIPPGLAQDAIRFKAQCATAFKNKTPVMICGPTGVGKTLFLKMFEKFFLEKYPKTPPKKVVKANCSHFEEKLSRSELFGHKKGAFTDAWEDHDGLLKAANKGLLVLEEVGDLPEPVQAQLLSYIETKDFHRMGDTETYNSEVQIVAATNKEHALREDFKYRFSLFYIPPLYKRRHDVLVYFAIKFPDLFRDLEPWEILSLLTYNWPGNVRELERYGEFLLINREDIRMKREILPNLRQVRKITGKDWLSDAGAGLENVKNYNAKINTNLASDLYFDLKQSRHNIDVVLLENLLNQSNVGLLSGGGKSPCKNFKISDLYTENAKAARDILGFITIYFEESYFY